MTITILPALSTETAITAFTVPGQEGLTTIGTGTVAIDVPFGTDVTGLVSTFTLSAGASALCGSNTSSKRCNCE